MVNKERGKDAHATLSYGIPARCIAAQSDEGCAGGGRFGRNLERRIGAGARLGEVDQYAA